MDRAGGVPAAGDSTRFPELAREEGSWPWTPLKLYRSADFDTTATHPRHGQRRCSTARSASPITRSPWPGGACTAPRTWDGCRRSARRRSGWRCWRTAPRGGRRAVRRHRHHARRDALAGRAEHRRAGVAAPLRRPGGQRARGAGDRRRTAGSSPLLDRGKRDPCRSRRTPGRRCCSPRRSRRTSGGTPSARSASPRGSWPTRWLDDDRMIPGQSDSVGADDLECRGRTR